MSAMSEMILEEINTVKELIKDAETRGESTAEHVERLRQLHARLAKANESLTESKVLKG